MGTSEDNPTDVKGYFYIHLTSSWVCAPISTKIGRIEKGFASTFGILIVLDPKKSSLQIPKNMKAAHLKGATFHFLFGLSQKCCDMLWNVSILSTQSWKFEICCPWKNVFAYFCLLFSFSHEPTEFYIYGTWCYVSKVDRGVLLFAVLSTILSLPKCGKGKPALVRRNTVDDKSELIACIETGNFAKAARIAAGEFAALCI